MHIFAMFVCLISGNLLIPTYGKHNIQPTTFLVMNIETPYIIDFIDSSLN
jgi:hypothetical protein